jgi:hypothetical protein
VRSRNYSDLLKTRNLLIFETVRFGLALLSSLVSDQQTTIAESSGPIVISLYLYPL